MLSTRGKNACKKEGQQDRSTEIDDHFGHPVMQCLPFFAEVHGLFEFEKIKDEQTGYTTRWQTR